MWIRVFLTGIALAAVSIPVVGYDRRTAAAVSVTDVGPCRDASEFRQRHGTSCLCCHEEFGVAGSVAHDAGIATVLITDRNGRELEIAPNPFDNFFRHAKMTPPLRAQIVFENGEVRSMKEPAPHGSCNACHGEIANTIGER